jgi:hypothetical protein
MQVELKDDELRIIVEALYYFYNGCVDYDILGLSENQMDKMKPKAWRLRNKILEIGKGKISV